MTLRTLVVIALRLYAIYWLTCGIADMATYLTFFFQASEKLGSYVDFQAAVVALVMFLIFLVLWFTAGWISARVTKGHDVQITAASLTLEDICRFAFIVLGLYFLLSSIVSLTQTGYRFFTFDFNLPDADDRKGIELANFTGHVLTAMAGLACILGSKRWSNKLIRLENKRETASPTLNS